MKISLISVASFLTLSAIAQLGSDRSVVAESVSSVVTNFSWKKDVITETDDYSLKDRQRVLASAANAAAQEQTAEGVASLASAWRRGFSNGVDSVQSSLSNVPRTGRFIGLRFPLVPQTSRKFDIYVASNHYDSASNEDILYIHFGQSFTNSPSMVVPYVWESGMTTQRVAGTWKKYGTTDHWTNTYDIVLRRSGSADIHYTCHKLHVPRPVGMQNIPCNLDPHGRWGTDMGVAFGSLLVTVTTGGTTYPTYTGMVTNQQEGVIAIFDNGAFLGTIPIEGE